MYKSEVLKASNLKNKKSRNDRDFQKAHDLYIVIVPRAPLSLPLHLGL